MVFYAVAKGRNVGVFPSWAECESQVKGFSGAKFKKFKTRTEADKFVAQSVSHQLTSPEKNNVLVSKKKGKGSLSALPMSEQYLAQKYGSAEIRAVIQQIADQNVAVPTPASSSVSSRTRSKYASVQQVPLGDTNQQKHLQSGKKPEPKKSNMRIKKEVKQEKKPDNAIFVKTEIKKEKDPETSQFFDDTDGDADLMLALSSLKEYPDAGRNSDLHGSPVIPKMTEEAKTFVKKIAAIDLNMGGLNFWDIYLAGWSNIEPLNRLPDYSSFNSRNRSHNAPVVQKPLGNHRLNQPKKSTKRLKKEVKQEKNLDDVIYVKTEIKKEDDLETSQFFDDTEGDADLMLALSALKEYPDAAKNSHLQGSATSPKIPTTIKPEPTKIGGLKFNVGNFSFVDVYIAGNYENVGHWNCMAGYGVYFSPNHPLNRAEPVNGKVSHYIGDLEAAIHAIQMALDVSIPRLCIHTGSEFLFKALTVWIFNWRQNGWRNQHGKVVCNRTEFQKLDKLLAESDIVVKWEYVKEKWPLIPAMAEAHKLSQIGIEDYLDMHPTKERDNSFDFYDVLGAYL